MIINAQVYVQKKEYDFLKVFDTILTKIIRQDLRDIFFRLS
jgi:hypothetical protein